MGEMNRREFLQAGGASGTGLLLAEYAGNGQETRKDGRSQEPAGDALSGRKPPEGVEGRAIWVYVGNSKEPIPQEAIDRHFEQIARANLNLVYLTIHDVGKTLKKAKELELEAHLNIHAMDYPDNKRDDRLSHKAPRGFYDPMPCVNHEEVRRHSIENILGYVEKYPALDGIHIDWVGQKVEWHHGPAWLTACYCDACRSGFRRDHGIDPVQIARDSGKHKEIVETWKRWRLDMVNRYVKELRDAIKNVNRDLLLSATAHQSAGIRDAVDGPYACSGNFQEWGRWMVEGWMEFFAPMAYTCDNEGFRHHMKQIRQVEEKAAGKSFAYAGIGQSYLVDERQLPEQIEIIRDSGVSGFSIFTSLMMVEDKTNKWYVARMEAPGEYWWKTLEECLDKPATLPHRHALVGQGV